MIEDLKTFFNNNTTMVLIAAVALVAIVGFFLFRSMNSGSSQTPFPTPSHDMDGMESMNSVCDMASGMCHPSEHMSQMTPEQEQQLAMQQQMMMQQMQQQQQEQKMQQQEQGQSQGQGQVSQEQ